MTINEARKELQEVLAVLDKLAAAVGGEERVINVTVGTMESKVHLLPETMRAVLAKFQELKTTLEPMGDGFSGGRRWSTSVDGVTVFAVLLEGETPEGGAEE